MQALIVVDAQNEFGPGGKRTAANHAEALEVIRDRIAEARAEGRPIAFIRHHNPEPDSDAFVRGSWGAEFSPGIGRLKGKENEAEFEKEVLGAFSSTPLEGWLRGREADSLLLVGFFAHMCVSTSAREAYDRNFNVAVDPNATASRPIKHDLLGEQTADDVRRTALLHLAGLGVAITPLEAKPRSLTVVTEAG